MNTVTFALVLVQVLGLVLLVIGGFYIGWPEQILRYAGDFTLDAAAKTDLRATYGGVHVVIGLYLLINAKRPEGIAASLQLLALLGLVVGLVRFAGSLASVEFSLLHAGIGLLESAAGLLLYGYYRRYYSRHLTPPPTFKR